VLTSAKELAILKEKEENKQKEKEEKEKRKQERLSKRKQKEDLAKKRLMIKQAKLVVKVRRSLSLAAEIPPALEVQVTTVSLVQVVMNHHWYLQQG